MIDADLVFSENETPLNGKALNGKASTRLRVEALLAPALGFEPRT